MNREELSGWVERYERAWMTNDPDDIRQLFTPEARYYTAPFREPWQGAEEIVSGWLGRKDDQGEWSFRFEILALADELGFVRGWATYKEPPAVYSNLWVVRLESDGRCSEFTEWWMEHA
jgi:hypothetical protein